jgi:hypothetical protein
MVISATINTSVTSCAIGRSRTVVEIRFGNLQRGRTSFLLPEKSQFIAEHRVRFVAELDDGSP